MKFNKWTVGLATVGVVSLASAARADEQMSQVQTALSQTTLSGYVDTAMQWNPGTDQNAFGTHIPNYAFAKNDGFQFNALDKPEDSSQWAAGYHVEMMYGADAVGIPVGTGATGASGAIRQAFIRLHTPVGGNGIDWQVGVFDNIIGYESNSDPLNPNYTRSYGYSIEPTTMTGILGTYKVNDEISFSGGVADNAGGLGTIVPTPIGNNTYEAQKTYMGDVSLTAPDSMGFLKGATLTAAAVSGNDSGQYGNGSTVNWYIGATLPTPITQLKVGAAFDYLMESDLNAVPTRSTLSDDVWVGGLYATYQASANMSVNLRAEYFSCSANPADVVPLYSGGSFNSNSGAPILGNQGEEFTATVQYNLWANVMTRGEFRWDHVASGNTFGASPNTGLPYKNDDFLLALNIIYQF
jgi:hypothetical protein